MSFDSVGEETGPKYPPRPPVGKHQILLRDIAKFPTQKKGEKVSAEYTILGDPKGTVYGDVWFYQDQGYAGKYHRKSLRTLGAAAATILGENPDDSEEIDTPIGKRTKGSIVIAGMLSKLTEKKNPGRGMVFQLTVTAVNQREEFVGKEPLVNTSYGPCPQTKEEIVARRRKLDEGDGPSMLDGII